jgi:uncharacterized protein YjdB
LVVKKRKRSSSGKENQRSADRVKEYVFMRQRRYDKMKIKRATKIVSALSLCFIASVALVSCLGAGTESVTVTSITVTTDNPSIASGSTAQFTATGTHSDATKSDITSQVSWASSDTNIAQIDNTGLATGVAAGTVTITASLGNVTGSAQLTVQ